MIKLKSLLEVLKDKDGNIRTDLKYSDNKNYQPRIELINSKNDGSGYPTITVKIDGGKPFDIEFDDHEEVDDHGYTKAIWLIESSLLLWTFGSKERRSSCYRSSVFDLCQNTWDFGRCGHYVCLKHRRIRFDSGRSHQICKIA